MFASCEKVEQKITPEKTNIQYELPDKLKSGITIKNEMVVFPDKKSFDELTTLLETENQKYVDAYFENKEDLSDDEINNLLSDDEYNLFAVYDAFEIYHSFYSARKHYFDLTDEWMEQCDDFVDFESKPMPKPISERLMPFANINGEYMIANTIYRVEDDGLVYEIKNSDFNALSSIRNNNGIKSRCLNKNTNIIVHRAEVRELSSRASSSDNPDIRDNETQCKAYVRRTHNHSWATNRWMHCALDIDWDGYGSAAKAKIECYKLESNWRGKPKTKREWRSMGAYVNVNDYRLDLSKEDGDESRCIYQRSKYELLHRNKAYYVSTRVTIVDDGLGARVVPGQEGGRFYLSDPNNYEYKMTW